MSMTVTLAILSAAFLHALWNFLVRKSDDKALGMAGVILGHVPLGVAGMLYAGLPSWEVWPLVMVSGGFHLCYQIFLLNAYRFGELTQVYPIARGSSPLIVTVVTVTVFSAELTTAHLMGITVISLTIIGHGLHQYRIVKASPTSLLLALLAGLCIAGYTMVDGHGTRQAGSALSFYGASTIMNALMFVPYLLMREKGTMTKLKQRDGIKLLVIGGTASYLAYATVLWAVLFAPIAVVSSLRETSVLFALLLGTVFLRERLTLAKIAMTVLVLTGIIILRLA
ncbi:MAG: EamA family transporter [Alphaproteobacteria bacterium]|nr:EamA family transporter [Alphaproteobacteria bacterium]